MSGNGCSFWKLRRPDIRCPCALRSRVCLLAYQSDKTGNLSREPDAQLTDRFRSPNKVLTVQKNTAFANSNIKAKNTESNKVEKQNPSPQASTRKERRRVFVYGGYSSSLQTLLDDLWELDTSGVDFQNSMDELPGALWTQITTKGSVDSLGTRPETRSCDGTAQKLAHCFWRHYSQH
jgi:hypothetical protein